MLGGIHLRDRSSFSAQSSRSLWEACKFSLLMMGDGTSPGGTEGSVPQQVAALVPWVHHGCEIIEEKRSDAAGTRESGRSFLLKPQNDLNQCKALSELDQAETLVLEDGQQTGMFQGTGMGRQTTQASLQEAADGHFPMQLLERRLNFSEIRRASASWNA